MTPFSSTTYAAGKLSSTVRFVELLCGSELTKERNFERRLELAIKKSEVPADILLKEETQELIHSYLSFYQHNGKYQQLFSKQIQSWRMHRLLLEDFQADDIGQREKMNDLCDKFDAQIEKLFNEIYGADPLIDIAKREIRKARSPEARLREKKQQAEV